MIPSYDDIKMSTDVQKHFQKMGSCFIRDLSNISITKVMCLPPKFVCYSPNPQDLRVWLYLEKGPLGGN